MTSQQLAPLLAWVAAKYAEELSPQFLQGAIEDLWGRHVIWLFLLTKPEGADPKDPKAIQAFLQDLSDEIMAPARQIFFETIERRKKSLEPLGTP